jgi:hypothetical protein
MKNRQWLLAQRPDGAIQDSDFKLVETDLPTPGSEGAQLDWLQRGVRLQRTEGLIRVHVRVYGDR